VVKHSDAHLFNFAAGAYPKESRIAHAKRNAVGGKRKRCTKGKNCSAACIAANMVCLVDLPWVGVELTKAKAQIQASKKNTPAGAPAPVAKPMAAPKPATPAPAAQPAAKPAPQPTAAPKPAAAAKPATPAPAAKPAAAPQPATPQPAAKPTPQAAPAPAPAPQPAAKPAPQPAAKTAQGAAATKKSGSSPTQPKSITVAPDEKWSSFRDKVEDAGISSSQFAVAMVKVAKAKGKSPSDITTVDDIPQLAALINRHLAGDKTALTMPAPTPKPQPPSQAKPSSAATTSTTPAASQKPTATQPLPKISPTAAANAPQKSSPGNPQGMSANQQKMWGDVFKKPDASFLQSYSDIGATFGAPNPFPKGTKEHAMFKLVKDSNRISNKLADADIDIAAGLTKNLPTSIKRAVNEMGAKDVETAIHYMRRFTGSSYEDIRASQMGVSHRTYKFMSPEDAKARQELWKERADKMEKLMDYLPKPQIPKFRGVPVDDAKLKLLQDLAKNKGSMEEKAMNSWSTDTETAMDFSRQRPGNTNSNVVFRTMNKRGVPVTALSGHGTENEILTKGNSKYQFYGYEAVTDKTGEVFHVFDVVEY
jgi:outer membrane biosynthesis protein TonB